MRKAGVVVVVVVLVAACSSKKDDHAAAAASGSGSAGTIDAAAAPAPPDADTTVVLNGVRVTSQRDHAVVVDAEGGYAIDLPGAATAEADTEGMPGVAVSVEADDALLMFKIKRLPPGVKNVAVAKQYANIIDDLTKKSWAFTVQEPMELAGKPGLHYVANKEMNGVALRIEAWILEVPRTTTLYQLIITTEAGKDVPTVWPMALASLREGPI